jgi:hypothetical protein
MRERRFDPGLLGLGDGLGLVAGLVLAVSSFTGWYTGEGQGVTISVLGWNTGVLGKLVLFVGLAVVLVLVLRELGVEPPAALPQSLRGDVASLAGLRRGLLGQGLQGAHDGLRPAGHRAVVERETQGHAHREDEQRAHDEGRDARPRAAPSGRPAAGGGRRALAHGA